jgi:hypothetical protein
MTDGSLVGTQQAHQPKTANTPTRLSSQINDEPVVVELATGFGHLLRYIDSNNAGEHGDLNEADSSVQLAKRNSLRYNDRRLQ